MKKTIRINEDTLKRIIKESIDEITNGAQPQGNVDAKEIIDDIYGAKEIALEKQLESIERIKSLFPNAINYVLQLFADKGVQLTPIRMYANNDDINLDVKIAYTPQFQEFLQRFENNVDEAFESILYEIGTDWWFKEEYGACVNYINANHIPTTMQEGGQMILEIKPMIPFED